MAVRTDLTWFDDEDLAFTCTATSATPITGWHFRLDIFPINSRTASISLTSGFTITGASAGVFTFSLPAGSGATTNVLTAGVYDYQLRRTDSGSNTMLAYGKVTVYGRPTPSP